ncbi:ankyrin repeat domain family member sosondowah [Arctopsyche grandis]|uniref:ankyrin repeat domain family member sosondowah n=1 Tax=Arctopsyche grandis TaxID=121162 RepID=UPI00406D66C5
MAAAPADLSIKEIWIFLKANGGKVTNHSLVKHFKPLLTNTDTRDAARDTFKQYVNILAAIKKENNEKFLVLKDEFMQNPPTNYPSQPTPKVSENDLSTYSADSSMDRTMPPMYEDIVPQLPPYRPAPEPVTPTYVSNNQDSYPRPSLINARPKFMRQPSVQDEDIPVQHIVREVSQTPPPPPQPTKWSSEVKVFEDQQDNVSEVGSIVSTEGKENLVSGSITSLNDNEQKLSVKECLKKFNKTQPDGPHIPRQHIPTRKPRGGDDDDKTSVTLLDSQGHIWITTASQCKYPILSKMATENPKLLSLKVSATSFTALHWAAKRGNEDLVKLLAGSAPKLVNMRSGYTPLHLAMQFRHESIYRLLKEVYSADINVRDYSGRKATDYLVNNEIISTEPFRKNKHKKKYSEKDLGFLRIGSLNMRVKKTTEAFSNFLGVGPGTRGVKPPFPRYASQMESSQDMTDEALRGTWGSADNIRNDKNKVQMPPPLFTKIKRKKKIGKDFSSSSSPQSRSTPSTPNEVRSIKDFDEDGISNATVSSESDSDTACGFDSTWQRK